MAQNQYLDRVYLGGKSRANTGMVTNGAMWIIIYSLMSLKVLKIRILNW